MIIDRRVARTRDALFDGLAALIVRKHYDAIKVQDILDEANVGRSTFYAHFTGKDNLLEGSLERLRGMLQVGFAARTAGSSASTEWNYSLTVFEHVADYSRHYHALAGNEAQQLLLGAFREAIVRSLKNVSALPKIETVPRELLVEHIASTFVTVVRWWLDRRPSLSPQQVDHLFRRLIRLEM